MNNQLLNNISQKLQQVRGQNLVDRRKEKQMFEDQIHLFQTTLQDRKNRQSIEINRTREHIDQLNLLLDQTLRGMSIQTSRETQKVNCLKEHLENKIQQAQRTHQERMEDIVEATQEKVVELTEDIEKKTRLQKEKVEGHLNTLSKKLAALQKDFKEESECRKVGVQRMKQTFYQQLDFLKEVVQKEQQRRVSSQRKFQGMAQQINQKLRVEMQNQTAKRKRNNQAMLKLIEVACVRIEQRCRQ